MEEAPYGVALMPDGVRVALSDRDGGADPVGVGVASSSVHASRVMAPLVPPGVESPSGHAVHAAEPSLSA